MNPKGYLSYTGYINFAFAFALIKMRTPITPIQTKRKRKRKFSVIFFACSLTFFAFAWFEWALTDHV